MRGYFFTKFDPSQDGKTSFDKLMELFMQLLTYTSGDVGEALQWLNELDRQFELTNPEYGMGDFIEDLKDKGYIDENRQTGEIKITPKTEQGIRKRSLEPGRHAERIRLGTGESATLTEDRQVEGAVGRPGRTRRGGDGRHHGPQIRRTSSAWEGQGTRGSATIGRRGELAMGP